MAAGNFNAESDLLIQFTLVNDSEQIFESIKHDPQVLRHRSKLTNENWHPLLPRTFYFRTNTRPPVATTLETGVETLRMKFHWFAFNEELDESFFWTERISKVANRF